MFLFFFFDSSVTLYEDRPFDSSIGRHARAGSASDAQFTLVQKQVICVAF